MPKITDSKILIIATDGFEKTELTVPRDKLREAGATVDIASLDGAPIRSWDETDWGEMAQAELRISDANVDDYDAIILPGGQINPDVLRTKPEAVDLVRDFYNAKKIVAAICHGPWMLVEAGVVKDRKLTSYPSIRTDILNAGGHWEDKEVVNDQALITSRNPGDLDAFVNKIIEEVEEGRHTQRSKAA
ncbi:type 1 glutamine amidotransferase domain-containing protein [Thioclava sp. GXIMD2076]|uniref:type 1 glutamine amidotransferase domain-containing protein n=1 Tax=unclassified Thioclava TaxID=2621713 RepID=UPI0030D38580